MDHNDVSGNHSSTVDIKVETEDNDECMEQGNVTGDAMSENGDLTSEVKCEYSKIDKYDGEELKTAIYQFLNSSDLKELKDNPDAKSITESNDFIKLTKDNNKPYACGVCTRQFSSVEGLVIHIRIHTGEKPFECTECGKGFTSHANLNKHMRTHNNIRPFECDICGAKFSLNQNMQTHKLRHTGERPHSCQVCGKTFTRSHHVKRHMVTHSDNPEKNYVCKECGRAFGRKENLQAHIKTHAKATDECVFCGQYFNGDTKLKAHIRETHPEENELFQITTPKKALSAKKLKTEQSLSI